MSLDNDIATFLTASFYHGAPPSDPDLPWVTLTYAQSLDARIAGKGGKQLRLSGAESMRLTHHLRARHDGIMVGIGTMLSDDPQLNARGVPQDISVNDQPRPIILDTNLRTPLDCKLIQNYRAGNGRQPWLVCSSKVADEKRTALTDAGAVVIVLDFGQDRIPLDSLFRELKRQGIHNLMIEGGSALISSCLISRSRSPEMRHLVSSMTVTVAPVMVGNDGVPVAASTEEAMPKLTRVRTTLLGNDCVFSCVPTHE